MILPHNLFKKLDGRNIDLVFTISSDAIGASLYYFSAGEAPRILAHVHRDMQASTDMSVGDLHDQALAILPQVCDDIAHKSQVVYELEDLLVDHQRIHHVTILIASPWTEKQVRNNATTLSQDNPVVTHDVINSLLEVEIPQGNTKLDTFVSAIKINGYHVPTEEVVGKNARELSVSCVDIFTRFDHIETLFQIIQTKFNVEEEQVTIRPFSSALFVGSGQVLNLQQDRVFLHVHAQYIDAFVYNDHAIVAHTSMGYGYQDIIEQIMKKKLAHTLEQAHSVLNMYINGHLEQKIHDELQDIIDIEMQVMNTILHDDAKEFSQDIYIPHDWYVLCDNELMDVIAKKIQESFPQNRITLINPDHVTDVIDSDQSDSATPGALLAGLYIDKAKLLPQE